VGLQKPSDCPFASYTDNALAPCLNFKRMKYFMDMAVASDEASQAEYNSRPQFFRAPIDGNVAGVCDTFIATADCDPLRDEGEAYGAKLLQAGVRVSSRRYTGVPHPFMHMLVIKKAQMYVDDICGELRRVHGA
jgi:acetyl esterase/lipase